MDKQYVVMIFQEGQDAYVCNKSFVDINLAYEKAHEICDGTEDCDYIVSEIEIVKQLAEKKNGCVDCPPPDATVSMLTSNGGWSLKPNFCPSCGTEIKR